MGREVGFLMRVIAEGPVCWTLCLSRIGTEGSNQLLVTLVGLMSGQKGGLYLDRYSTLYDLNLLNMRSMPFFQSIKKASATLYIAMPREAWKTSVWRSRVQAEATSPNRVVRGLEIRRRGDRLLPLDPPCSA